MALITWTQAKDHLRLFADSEEIADVRLKMEQATAIAIKFLDGNADATWTDATNPAEDIDFAILQAGILVILGDLYFNTGDQPDDWRQDPQTGVVLSPRARRVLHPLRDPVCA